MKNALEGNRWLLWLGLQRQTVDARERGRDVLGAMLGLWVAGALTWWGWGATSPWLAATMGASAVLHSSALRCLAGRRRLWYSCLVAIDPLARRDLSFRAARVDGWPHGGTVAAHVRRDPRLSASWSRNWSARPCRKSRFRRGRR